MNESPVTFPSDVSNPMGTLPRLTNRQMAIMRDLANGWDIAQISERRGRSLSSVYEIAARICVRIGVDEWTQIGPYARAHGIVDPVEPENVEYPA